MNNEEKILTLLEKHSVVLERLESKVDKLETEVGGLRTEVGGLRTEVGGLRTEVGDLRTKVEKLEIKVDNLEIALADTRHHVISIENNHGKALGALHDGYVLTYEILSKEIRPDIAKIKQELEMHDLRIKAFELIS